MKKILSMLGAALLLAGSLAFTGCDEVANELADELAPENTWCELPVDLGSDGEPDVYLDVIFCPKNYSGTAGSANLKKSINLEAGITVVAWAKVAVESLGMTAGSYAIKSFPLNGTDNNSDENFSFAGTKVKWGAIYLAKKDLRNSSTQIRLPAAPGAVTNSSTYVEVTDLEHFNWKALLASYLLN